MAKDAISTRHNLELAAKSTASAFLFGYVSAVAPRIASLLVNASRKRSEREYLFYEINYALRSGFKPNRFPAFCAAVIGGAATLRVPLNIILQILDAQVHGGKSPRRTRNNRMAASFVAALLASIAGFRMLNMRTKEQRVVVGGRPRAATDASINSVDSPDGRQTKPSRIPQGLPSPPVKARTFKPPVVALGVPLAGKTIDLTLFVAVQAADILAQTWYISRPPQNRFLRWLTDHASPLFFALSSATIMHAFFYSPSRLPYTYVKWIDRIAECDERLIESLRQAYYNNFVYGKDTGLAPLLGSMAKDLGLPEEWGDPAKTIPVPCELVHHGVTKSCEKHALWRFYCAWRMAISVYAPIQAVILLQALVNRSTNRSAAVKRALVDTARSSGFLGAFVALFYYGVCLMRTRLGPALLSQKTVSYQMLDSGLCVDGGCALCGLSVLVEFPKRRTELMLFVLPRALGVWVPRRYIMEHRWREEAAFAVSTAIVLTALQETPGMVRGVFGRLLRRLAAG